MFESAVFEVLFVGVGGAVGAPLRWWLSRRFDAGYAWGVWIANTVGCFLLGVVVGWSVTGPTYALVAVGFCGGLTTYSTFAVHTHELGFWRGLGYAFVTLLAGVTAVSLGLLASGL